MQAQSPETNPGPQTGCCEPWSIKKNIDYSYLGATLGCVASGCMDGYTCCFYTGSGYLLGAVLNHVCQNEHNSRKTRTVASSATAFFATTPLVKVSYASERIHREAPVTTQPRLSSHVHHD